MDPGAQTVLRETTVLRDLLSPYDIDGLDNRNDERVESACRWLGKLLTAYFRAEVRGVDRVPPGAALYVGNHNGAMQNPEAYLLAAALCDHYGVDYVPYGLGHEWAINLPLINQLIVPLGAVRASHRNAERLFQRGKKVIVYPGSDYDAMRPYRWRNRIVFGGRTGYMSLVIRAGVPLVPVVTAGAQEVFVVLNEGKRTAELLGVDRLLRIKVWPWTLSIPWGLTFGPPPLYVPYPSRIIIEILPPMHFERSGQQAAQDEAYVRACADRVQSTMQTKLDELSAERESR